MNSVPDFSCRQTDVGVTVSDSAEFGEHELDRLRDSVRGYYTEKRYAHALAVEAEVARLGELFLPRRIHALRAAALLHDITKKIDLEKQLKCCADFGIIIKTPVSPEILHAVTGSLIARKEFPEYTDSEILGGIRWHTTGRWGMTVFEAIVFLADYIEPTRTHESCISVRNELYGHLNGSQTAGEQERALNRAVLKALDNTISYLVSKNLIIEPDTVLARNYYLSEKEL